MHDTSAAYLNMIAAYQLRKTCTLLQYKGLVARLQGPCTGTTRRL